MYQGGSNPVGKHGTFLNEAQVPKISYDYQACLGEFGQVRESYQRLKTIHSFVSTYEEQLCDMKTYLPEGASQIDPKDLDTLRYAVRSNGESGFLFINNFQDHAKMHPKKDVSVTIEMGETSYVFHSLSLETDENCILPFHFDVEGIELTLASAQPITDLEINGRKTYIFMVPDGMHSYFVWEDGVNVNGSPCKEYMLDPQKEVQLFTITKGEKEVDILCLSRDFSNQMYVIKDQGLLFTSAAFMERDDAFYLEATEAVMQLKCYPKALCEEYKNAEKIEKTEALKDSVLGTYKITTEQVHVDTKIKEVGFYRYAISFDGLKEAFMGEHVKDVRMQIEYRGDIGHAFIDGRMIHDNFCNHDTWEIGLREFASELEQEPMTIYITPLKEGAKVNVESTMAARMEEVDETFAELRKVSMVPVYEVRLEK